MANLWDERGFFYYRRLRFFTIRTSYMRWTQAWMFLALATILESTSTDPPESPHRTASANASAKVS
jgi:hypothetical protein